MYELLICGIYFEIYLHKYKIEKIYTLKISQILF